MTRVAIIGGGIAGLAAAYHLIKQIPAGEVSLLEAGPRWGGKIATEYVEFGNGEFVIEAGPDSFLASKAQAVTLCKELGIAEHLQGTRATAGHTYILHDNQLKPMPQGLSMMIPTNWPAILGSPLLSWQGKARLGLEPLLPRGSQGRDESLGAFISRRLGREVYENISEPLLSGIYAGDGDRLSLESTFPNLRELEVKRRSLYLGAREARKKAAAPAGSRSAFLTPVGGLGELTDALVDRLAGVDLRLNSSALGIRKNENSYSIDLGEREELQAQAIIVATPAYAGAVLLEHFDPLLASALAGIPYASSATVSLGYRLQDIPRPLDGYGYVIPRKAGRTALACTWTSTKFESRAPSGYALLRVFIGRAGQDDEIAWDVSNLLHLAREELRQTLGIQAEPSVSRVFVWQRGMPQYNLGHGQLLERIDSRLEQHAGLALAGNSYRGVGIPDCIRSGELAAEKVCAALAARSVPGM